MNETAGSGCETLMRAVRKSLCLVLCRGFLCLFSFWLFVKRHRGLRTGNDDFGLEIGFF